MRCATCAPRVTRYYPGSAKGRPGVLFKGNVGRLFFSKAITEKEVER